VINRHPKEEGIASAPHVEVANHGESRLTQASALCLR
jgi:hypothetical protein